MPTNVTVEYIKAEERFRDAKTKEEKIAGLEEMLSTLPGHKGCDHLRAELKSKLAKLKKLTEKRAGGKGFSIPKEGDAQVCIIGVTQSGKSTLLRELTNAKPKISNVPFTTVRPEIGCIEWTGVKIQLIEMPATFERMHMSVAQISDGLVIVYRNEKQKEEIKKIVGQFYLEKKPAIEIDMSEKIDKGKPEGFPISHFPKCAWEEHQNDFQSAEKLQAQKGNNVDTEKIKEKIWGLLGLVRIYTKEPGRKPAQKALVMKKGSTIRRACLEIHKDFLKFFKFARVWGSTKYPGERVGLDYILKDKDILEIHIA